MHRNSIRALPKASIFPSWTKNSSLVRLFQGCKQHLIPSIQWLCYGHWLLDELCSCTEDTVVFSDVSRRSICVMTFLSGKRERCKKQSRYSLKQLTITTRANLAIVSELRFDGSISRQIPPWTHCTGMSLILDCNTNLKERTILFCTICNEHIILFCLMYNT